jgi:hypothetical protein
MLRAQLKCKILALLAVLAMLVQNGDDFQRFVSKFVISLSSESVMMSSKTSSDDKKEPHQSAPSWKQLYIEFQDDVRIARDKFVKSLGELPVPDLDALAAVANTSRIVLNGGQPDYVLQLPKGSTSLTNYTTVVTSQARQPSLVLTKQYYRAQATPPACEWFPNPKNRFINCLNETSLNAAQLAPISIKGGIPIREDYRLFVPVADYIPEHYFSHLTFVAYARINEHGCVLSSDLVIAQQGCFTDGRKICKFNAKPHQIVKVPEVFIVSQYWGNGYYHMHTENFPRIAPYVEFLQEHPDIRVHVVFPPRFDIRSKEHILKTMELFKIDRTRVIGGNVQADVVYVPKSTPCIRGMLPEIQILQSRFHEYIEQDLRETRHNSVVLIIRQSPFSKSRNIPRSIYEIMRKELDRLVANTNLKLEVFDDKDNVSFADTLKMFHRARLIVGILI